MFTGAIKRSARSSRAGFSMVEMMVVLVIIGILATMIGPRVVSFLSRGKQTSTTATMATLKQALQEYYNDIGHFPTKAEGGIKALVQPPKNQAIRKKWDGPYLEGQDEIPEDGWGYEFEYYSPPRQKGKYRHFEVVSHGEEGPDGNSDEIVVGA